MKLRLTAKTNKAKRRARDAGTDIWIVVEKSDTVLFSDKMGPWYYIRPDTNGQSMEHARWVHHNDDFDFIVVEIKE